MARHVGTCPNTGERSPTTRMRGPATWVDGQSTILYDAPRGHMSEQWRAESDHMDAWSDHLDVWSDHLDVWSGHMDAWSEHMDAWSDPWTRGQPLECVVRALAGVARHWTQVRAVECVLRPHGWVVRPHGCVVRPQGWVVRALRNVRATWTHVQALESIVGPRGLVVRALADVARHWTHVRAVVSLVGLHGCVLRRQRWVVRPLRVHALTTWVSGQSTRQMLEQWMCSPTTSTHIRAVEEVVRPHRWAVRAQAWWCDTLTHG